MYVGFRAQAVACEFKASGHKVEGRGMKGCKGGGGAWLVGFRVSTLGGSDMLVSGLRLKYGILAFCRFSCTCIPDIFD